MGNAQFYNRQDISGQTLSNVTTTAEITANTANQYDGDSVNTDVSTETFETGEQNISGATALVGAVTVNDSGDANVIAEWTDGTGTVVYSEQLSDLQGITSSKSFALRVKSTHVNLKVSGTSTDADITVNAH
jgi:hypothetical protein